MKLVLGIGVFLLGLVVGAVIVSGVWISQDQSSEVWTAKMDLTSRDGIVIPAGTELVLTEWMPEGFAALNLGINVEGEALQRFDRRVEPIRLLRIPQFVYGGGE